MPPGGGGPGDQVSRSVGPHTWRGALGPLSGGARGDPTSPFILRGEVESRICFSTFARGVRVWRFLSLRATHLVGSCLLKREVAFRNSLSSVGDATS